MTTTKGIARGFMLAYALVAFALAGCSSSTPIEEGSYVGDTPVNTAVVQYNGDGGYRTLSGDPYIAYNGGLEQESMMPYGGGNEGIRQAEDESLPSAGNLGNP